MHRGTAYTLGTEIEIEFGELLVERNHNFEKIRFVNSGTEAVMSMIKAARAYTGRPKIAKAEGAYHGTYDFAEISQIIKPDNRGDINHPNSVPVTFGTPECVKNDVVVFPYNDTERTLNLLEANKEHLACVLIDPVSHRIGMFPIEEDYLIAIYEWTRKNKVLLVFDEVDVGISGGTAEVVGNLLRDLGSHAQILCITHQPQVAAKGHYHWQVQKYNQDNKTLSRVINLSHQQRVEEIARMSGGLTITAETLKHAASMLS